MRSGLLFVVILLASCATPVPPSGGPRDETPPILLETSPPAGEVNFTGQSVRITFSEYVDPASFARAFQMTPAFDRPVDISWHGRSVEIRFPEPLRENTTYVLTLDTNLRDIHSVALNAPVTLAFSTGPTISRGTLAGLVVMEVDGSAVAGVEVFAYALPDSTAPDTLAARPDYRTQTGKDGAFRFEYLTERFYFVAAVRDANRNARPDPNEMFAPPPAPAVRADSTPVDLGLPWVLARLDTVPPVPLRVSSLSDRRHVVHFSEDVRLTDRDPANWTLADSATSARREIAGVYMTSSEQRQVVFVTEPLAQNRTRVIARAIVDTSANPVIERPLDFTPSAAADTVRTRFLSFLPGGTTSPFTLPRGFEPALRFTAPVDSGRFAASVFVRDTSGAVLRFNTATQNGTDYEIFPDPPLSPGRRIEVAVEGRALGNPDSVYTFTYERLSSDLVGEISGIVTGGSGVVVEARPVEVDMLVPDHHVRADSTGRFIFREMPSGTYRLRLWSDVDGDGRRDPGMLMPYVRPEVMLWPAEEVRVRARWETALPDTLRMPSLSPNP